MNPDQPSREQIEARLTALLLGELPAEEAELLRWTISQDAELQKLYDRLKQTIGLVRETLAQPAEASAETAVPRRLSEERRRKLLAHFKTPRPKPSFWLRPILPVPRLVTVMVLLAVLAVLASLLLPALSASKRRAMSVTTLGGNPVPEMELRALSMKSSPHKQMAASAPPAAVPPPASVAPTPPAPVMKPQPVAFTLSDGGQAHEVSPGGIVLPERQPVASEGGIFSAGTQGELNVPSNPRLPSEALNGSLFTGETSQSGAPGEGIGGGGAGGAAAANHFTFAWDNSEANRAAAGNLGVSPNTRGQMYGATPGANVTVNGTAPEAFDHGVAVGGSAPSSELNQGLNVAGAVNVPILRNTQQVGSLARGDTFQDRLAKTGQLASGSVASSAPAAPARVREISGEFALSDSTAGGGGGGGGGTATFGAGTSTDNWKAVGTTAAGRKLARNRDHDKEMAALEPGTSGLKEAAGTGLQGQPSGQAGQITPNEASQTTNSVALFFTGRTGAEASTVRRTVGQPTSAASRVAATVSTAEEVEVQQALKRYAELTGRTMLKNALPPSGKVTLPNPPSASEAEQVKDLEAALAADNVAVINVGEKSFKALPVSEANAAGVAIDQTDLPAKRPSLPPPAGNPDARECVLHVFAQRQRRVVQAGGREPRKGPDAGGGVHPQRGIHQRV